MNKNSNVTGYFTGSIHQGLTKKQLLKLIEHLPENGLYIPHSVRNDSDDERQIFGFLYVTHDMKPIDEGEIESINADLSILYGRNSIIKPNIYKSHNNRKYFLKNEKITHKDIVLKNSNKEGNDNEI